MSIFKIVNGRVVGQDVAALPKIPDSYLGHLYGRSANLHVSAIIDPFDSYSKRLYQEFLKQDNYQIGSLDAKLLQSAMKDWYPNYEKRLNQWSKSVGGYLGLVAGPRLSYRLKDQAAIEMRKERERSYGKK